MKASFYFVLWMGLYFIFDLVNIPFLQNNAFIAAFILVIFISNIINKNLVNDIRAEKQSALIHFYEDVYTNAIAKYRRQVMYNLCLYSIFAIYFLITFVWIIRSTRGAFLGDRIFEMVIFGALSFYYVYKSYKFSSSYASLRKTNNLLDYFSELQYNESYAAYCGRRTTMTFGQILQSEPKVSSGYRITGIVFAILSIILGIWFLKISLPGFFRLSGAGIFLLMLTLYGALAIQAGIKDLISLNR